MDGTCKPFLVSSHGNCQSGKSAATASTINHMHESTDMVVLLVRNTAQSVDDMYGTMARLLPPTTRVISVTNTEPYNIVINAELGKCVLIVNKHKTVLEKTIAVLADLDRTHGTVVDEAHENQLAANQVLVDLEREIIGRGMVCNAGYVHA